MQLLKLSTLKNLLASTIIAAPVYTRLLDTIEDEIRDPSEKASLVGPSNNPTDDLIPYEEARGTEPKDPLEEASLGGPANDLEEASLVGPADNLQSTLETL